MTRPVPPAERRKPNLPLNGKTGAIMIGAIALIVLQPGAERLWNRLQAPGLERRMGGPGFPVTMDQAALRIEQSRGPVLATTWSSVRREGQDCRSITAGAFWRVCGVGGRPRTISADVIVRTHAEAAREMTVLVDAAARGATPAQRQAALRLVTGRKSGSVRIGGVRISALPLRTGGWYLDARPA
ncbi:hypothetical protein [Caulobacter sp. NIBR1757]|uniref:hypothetical protein n=1 Tax=Caulobacter sp. NIBR1757 TaxID=3016000 RepID=UPI0022F0A061|nr:hypothetical protein [Caulobacter sp. NIBR1757]